MREREPSMRQRQRGRDNERKRERGATRVTKVGEGERGGRETVAKRRSQ